MAVNNWRAQSYIQGAAAERGMSGGATLDNNGRVVGINSNIRFDTQETLGTNVSSVVHLYGAYFQTRIRYGKDGQLTGPNIVKISPFEKLPLKTD